MRPGPALAAITLSLYIFSPWASAQPLIFWDLEADPPFQVMQVEVDATQVNFMIPMKGGKWMAYTNPVLNKESIFEAIAPEDLAQMQNDVGEELMSGDLYTLEVEVANMQYAIALGKSGQFHLFLNMEPVGYQPMGTTVDDNCSLLLTEPLHSKARN